MPKFAKRALLLLLTGVMLSASLYGCTGGTNNGTTPSASAQTGEPSNGSSVTVGIAQDLDSLDPHKAISAGVSEVLFNVFEGLMKASPDGGVSPAVASDYTVSKDGLTYTFTLREGVKFHNGNAVTMEDVLYSLERCAGSENDGTPLISAFSNVTSIAAQDETHVVLTLAEPSLEFINSMTAAIIPAGSGESMATAPVGTGPFAFVSYTPQMSLEVTDVNTLVMGLQSGTLDMAIHLPNTVRSQVEGQFTVLQDTMKLVQALYINNAVKPFDDVRVRQAMYYAINVQEIIDLVCDGDGVATGTSMYPAFTKYFMPELAENYQQDVEKAKELLAQAGYPNGFDMTITVPSNYPQHVETGEVIIQQLSAVGINATLELVEWEAWVSDVYRGRDFQTTVCGVAASDMTAREMLERYVSDYSKNFINFNSQEYDQVLQQALTTLDAAEQLELYRQAQTILNEEAASLWIQDLCDLVVMDPALDGMTFYATYVLDMSTIYFK